MTIFEEIQSLSPVQFFAISWNCPYLRKSTLQVNSDYRLPCVADLCSEESFADLYMGWSEEKIAIEAHVHDRSEEDSIELFFDTRDLKSKSHISKFCHQFVFTPDEKDGLHGRETTRFYSDDLHRICDPEDLSITVDSSDKSYALKIQISAHCLYGYDPIQFPRLGFSYRINRATGSAQHFAVSSEEFSIERHPSLWATVKLTGERS